MSADDDRRKALNEAHRPDPFYKTPSWGLQRPGGGSADDGLGQSQAPLIVKPRRIQTYTVYQRSLDLPAVLAGAPLLQLVPAAYSQQPGQALIATAAGILGVTLSLKSAVQGEFALAPCLTIGTPNADARATFAGNVVSMAEGGWRPLQGPCSLIAGFGATNGWAVAPTFPTLTSNGSTDGEQFEQVVLPAVIGSSVSWLYGVDDPLASRELVSDGSVVPKGVVLWNQAGAPSPAVRVTVRWVEFSIANAPYIWT